MNKKWWRSDEAWKINIWADVRALKVKYENFDNILLIMIEIKKFHPAQVKSNAIKNSKSEFYRSKAENIFALENSKFSSPLPGFSLL